MRKALWACAVALALVGPALYAQPDETQETTNTEAAWWTESTGEADSCRLECEAEDADPYECQEDCNVVI